LIPDLTAEAIKAALTLTTSCTTLALGWFVGSRITAGWDQRKKRREVTMATAEAFYKSYGEFFAIWKEWSAVYAASSLDGGDAKRFSLLNRAAVAEGAVEALLLKLAVERRLTPVDVDTLGCFRQAYQVMRESIRDNRLVGIGDNQWRSSEAPDYVVFKGLATRVAQIVAREDAAPDTASTRIAFREITSNRFETGWPKIGHRLLQDSGATTPS
jgi:hypothetical protein